MNKYIFYSDWYNSKKKAKNRKKIVLIVLFSLILFTLIPFIRENYSDISCKYSTRHKKLTEKKVKKQKKTIPITVKEFKVKGGNTLTSILSPYIPLSEIYYIVEKSSKFYPLNSLVRGHIYRLYFKKDKVVKFEYEIDDSKKVVVNLSSSSYSIYVSKIKYNIQNAFISAKIDSSLFESVEKIGERDSLALKLADIFAWDIDFIRDIREGDSFKAVVQKKFRKGKFKGYGNIIAAEFINQGHKYTAFLYTTSKGRREYFSKDGVPLRKSFLKAPLKFTRISSRFSYHRFHPILKKVLPHLGVDYAAPRGTPIKSVADGVIIRASWGRAAGNYIKIRHPNGYVTIYNHMCRFARGIKKGVRVKQGEVIGYVGATGYATGPHLDFRVKHYGKFINPLKIKSIPLRPLSPAELARFKSAISPLVAILESPNRIVAQRELKKMPQNEAESSLQKKM